MDNEHRAIAIVGLGATLPDAPDAATFWSNIRGGRYSISEVDPERWDPARYYDPDPRAPDKTYSSIGGWVREWDWDPFKWKLPIPPTVTERMDIAQRWAIACTRAALADYGYPARPLETERTAVILGNAMGGELHYLTALRIFFPEFGRHLESAPSFAALPAELREAIEAEAHHGLSSATPDITEDSMPGELANCIAGRIANLYNLHGPNYVVDAACASAMAAMSAAVEGLIKGDFDAVLSGGIDRNMGASTFVKFCKIGALSATGTRPYGDGADGFVMGEGAAVFLLKRLADAERDGDHIYAVLRGLGGSSDGKGKGITAPNPIGQKLAIRRGWENAGLSPATAGFVEGHGTSTKVGDVVEVESLTEVFAAAGAKPGTVRLGSVKSNLGHLKGAAGAAGLLKATLALHDKVIPPSLNCERRNPNIDFAQSPFTVNTELEEWKPSNGTPRRAGVSAFGFGGTNFHVVLEEHVPGMIGSKQTFAGADFETSPAPSGGGNGSGTPAGSGSGAGSGGPTAKQPPGNVAFAAATTVDALKSRLVAIQREAEAGRVPRPEAPLESELKAPERVAIDFTDAADLAQKAGKAVAALDAEQPKRWSVLASQGVYRGRGSAPKVAFLYTGQGSQYANMLADLRRDEPIVAAVFEEADRVMRPLIGRPLSDFIFVDPSDPEAMAAAEESLRQTTITQPAVLSVDTALTRLLADYGVEPDMVMGHSLGEYGALVTAGAIDFAHALEAVSARGREMTRVSTGDNGAMAAVSAPIPLVEEVLAGIDGYVVIANINSTTQAVIGGEAGAVAKAVAALEKRDVRCVPLTVSHAFHTRIVAPASVGLSKVLQRLGLHRPRIPIVSNVTGEFYPDGPSAVDEMVDLLGRQVASPVQFVKGLETLFDAGARVFVEVGPKRALTGFTQDVLGDRPGVLPLFTNHPRLGDAGSVTRCLAGLWAAGLGRGRVEAQLPPARVMPNGDTRPVEKTSPSPRPTPVELPLTQTPVAEVRPTPAVDTFATPRLQPVPAMPEIPLVAPSSGPSNASQTFLEAARIFADFLGRGLQDVARVAPEPRAAPQPVASQSPAIPVAADPGTRVVVTGVAVGLPGADRVFDDTNLERILRGDVMIEAVPTTLRDRMADMHVTRLVKPANEDPRFERIDDVGEVIKLAGRGGEFDLTAEFGVNAERAEAFDACTRLAIAAGIDALRDAGIPLVRHYRTTSLGTQLPEGWRLPDELRDETGVIFASAFPGVEPIIDDVTRYNEDLAIRQRLADLEGVREMLAESQPGSAALAEVDRRIAELRSDLEKHPFSFNRRFLFRVLAMGHSQFAEEIGARGPNTQVNSACATTTLALGVAEDWIRAGRCRRVIVVAGDDVTRDGMMEWFGAAFLASGAAATDERVEDAAIPFDRRRHGMIMGMGGAALVVENADAAAERGVRPICEVLGTVSANSAFHGSRLDIDHISDVMEKLVSGVERRWGLRRDRMAPETVFVSHETYTPARGGSASAEVYALRRVFGPEADRIVIANTKGFTGHAMAVGIEDVIAVRALETGIVPPVPNLREVDPELGNLNLSKGGPHPVRYALRLGAGFGSQISMALLAWTPTTDGTHPSPDGLGFGYRVSDPATFRSWLARMSGYASPELEIEHHRLRIRDQGPPQRAAEAAQPAAKRSRTTTAGVTALAVEAHAQPAAPPALAASPRAAPTPAVSSATAAPETAATAAPPAGAASSPDPIAAEVLRIVSEQTGYPPDMLDMDLDLEADLGIDTVKQAETFAAIRGRWDIPRDENLKLRDYPTLHHVVRFVLERSPEAVAAQAMAGTAVVTAEPPTAPATASSRSVAPPATQPPARSGAHPIAAEVLRIVSEQTGYPPDMLDMDLDLEADLGIDTVKQAETFAAIRGRWDIPRDENLKLRDYPTLHHVVQFVLERSPSAAAAAGPPATPSPVREDTSAAAATTDTAIGAASDKSTAGASVNGDDDIAQGVLRIVSEQTGYPPDMLDMDLDLEADLGIDTVKQAETFAAIRQAWNIPRDENLKLRDYPTLTHVMQFVRERMPAEPVTESAAVPPDDASSPAAGTTVPAGSMDAADAVPRRVPRPVVRPPLELCKQTGVDLSEGDRVLVMMDRGGTGAALVERLTRLGVESIAIEEAVDAAALESLIDASLEAGPIRGVYWLPALDAEPALQDLELADWREALRHRVKLLYTAMRRLYAPMKGPGTFLVAATRLGGLHGYDDAGALNPMGGAVTGFVKAFARERPAVLSKAVDFESSRKTAALADILIDETLRDPGAVEIGIHGGRRWTIGLREMPPGDGTGGIPLGADSVYAITGAAGSIVSAIVADLATHGSGGTFHLFDLAAEPDPADPDLARFATDRDGLRRDIFERMKAAGQRATPALVEKELARLERAHAALDAIRAIEAAGGTAHWYSVDLRDGEAVRQAMDRVRESSGHIDLIVHAAGLEISRYLPDKEPAEYDLVFDVKADGWFNVMKAAGDMPIGATVAFSSIAGRFGNGGQTDYSAANDLLCKCASGLRTHRPGTRGLAIDWTAWGGIGMASRGSIPRMMEVARIDMLQPEAGIPVVRREVTSAPDGSEVVIANGLGIMLDDNDDTGGADIASLEARAHGPMIGHVVRMGVNDGLVVETELDPKAQPFLDDHRIDGTAVLPGVMGVEAFAELATLPLPGYRIAAMEDIRFLAPFKFYRDEPRTVRLEAIFEPTAEGVVADCRLIGERNLPGQDRPQVTNHFSAKVRLVEGDMADETEPVPVPAAAAGEETSAEAIYRVYFHGPAYRVLDRAWRDKGAVIGRMSDDLRPNHEPSGLPLTSAPRHIELCFQAAGLHGIAVDGTLGLPLSVGELRMFARPEGPCIAQVRPTDDGYDAEVIDTNGRLCIRIEDYRTIPLPGAGAGEAVEAIRTGLEGARA